MVTAAPARSFSTGESELLSGPWRRRRMRYNHHRRPGHTCQPPSASAGLSRRPRFNVASARQDSSCRPKACWTMSPIRQGQVRLWLAGIQSMPGYDKIVRAVLRAAERRYGGR
jgi:hypothetical protein